MWAIYVTERGIDKADNDPKSMMDQCIAYNDHILDVLIAIAYHCEPLKIDITKPIVEWCNSDAFDKIDCDYEDIEYLFKNGYICIIWVEG